MKCGSIYIVSPDIVTGGPESLHYLCHQLNLLNIKSYIYYYEGSGKNCREAYSSYNAPVADKIIDDPSSIVIIPETYIETIELYIHSKIYIFWLSVEYAYISRKFRNKLFRYLDYLIRPKNYFGNSIGLCENLRRRLSLLMRDTSAFQKIQNKASGHLCNSYYAISLCSQLDYKNINRLRVPIRDIFDITETNLRKNIILYNPAKSSRFVRKLKIIYPKLRFIPLQNMNPDQIRETMKMSKIFIDFGKHPGRERMPREAALCGCIIITNSRGSAGGKDLPIPDKFKVRENVFSAGKLIKHCLRNYDINFIEFENYVSLLREDYNDFKFDLSSFLDKVIFRIK